MISHYLFFILRSNGHPVGLSDQGWGTKALKYGEERGKRGERGARMARRAEVRRHKDVEKHEDANSDTHEPGDTAP
jgi:hypothetical protein